VTVPRRARVAPAPPASCLLLSSRLAPASTLFPYTTLFRSNPGLAVLAAMASGIALIGVWLFVAFGRGAEKYGKAILIAFSLLERSEEHTSELQSRFDLVCRLLLEKKKYKRIASKSRANVAI